MLACLRALQNESIGQLDPLLVSNASRPSSVHVHISRPASLCIASRVFCYRAISDISLAWPRSYRNVQPSIVRYQFCPAFILEGPEGEKGSMSQERPCSETYSIA